MEGTQIQAEGALQWDVSNCIRHKHCKVPQCLASHHGKPAPFLKTSCKKKISPTPHPIFVCNPLPLCSQLPKSPVAVPHLSPLFCSLTCRTWLLKSLRKCTWTLTGRCGSPCYRNSQWGPQPYAVQRGGCSPLLPSRGAHVYFLLLLRTGFNETWEQRWERHSLPC